VSLDFKRIIEITTPAGLLRFATSRDQKLPPMNVSFKHGTSNPTIVTFDLGAHELADLRDYFVDAVEKLDRDNNANEKAYIKTLKHA